MWSLVWFCWNALLICVYVGTLSTQPTVRFFNYLWITVFTIVWHPVFLLPPNAGSEHHSCVRNRRHVLVVTHRRALCAMRCHQWLRFDIEHNRCNHLHNDQRAQQSAQRRRLVCGLLPHVSAARGLRMRHSTRSHRMLRDLACTCIRTVLFKYITRTQFLYFDWQRLLF